MVLATSRSPPQVSYWRQLGLEASDSQAKAEAEHQKALQRLQQQVPELEQQNQRAKDIIDALEQEVQQLKLARRDTQAQLEEQVQGLTERLQQLTADNVVLRAELAKTVHTRHSTNSKLDEARKKLGLTEQEAFYFVKV